MRKKMKTIAMHTIRTTIFGTALLWFGVQGAWGDGDRARPLGVSAASQPFREHVLNRVTGSLQVRDALGRSGTDKQRFRINMYGDSATWGAGGLCQKNSPAQRLADELARRGIPATANTFGMAVGTTAQQTKYDPRLSFTGTWGGWSGVQGGNCARCTSPGGTWAYAPEIPCNAFSLFYHSGSVPPGEEGTMAITVDGGATRFSTLTSGGLVSSQTISTAGERSMREVVITVESLGIHTLTVANGEARRIEVYGAEAWDTNAGGVLIRAMAASGYTSANLASPERLACIRATPCELSILCIGANDCHRGLPLADYSANLAKLIAAMRAGGSSDILFWTWAAYDPAVASTEKQKEYVDTLVAAAGTTIIVADLWNWSRARGGFPALKESGWFYDQLHPSAPGNTDIGRFLATAILDR